MKKTIIYLSLIVCITIIGSTSCKHTLTKEERDLQIADSLRVVDSLALTLQVDTCKMSKECSDSLKVKENCNGK